MSLCSAARGENELTSIQIVGKVVRASGTVRIEAGATVGEVIAKAKPTEFASTRSLVVIRIEQIYDHVGDDLVSGSDRRFIDLRVTPKTKFKSLPLKPGDVLYVPAKRPVQR